MGRRTISINGEPWCRNLTGIERLAIGVTKYLDGYVRPGQIELVVPRNAENLPELKNIKTVTLPVNADFMPKWTQVHFQGYVLRHHSVSLDFSNTCPFLCPGIEFIHDIYCRLYPQEFVSKRDRLINFYSRIMYSRIAKKAKAVITVSDYTKSTITAAYKISPERISVVYSGLSAEYSQLKPDFSVFGRFPVLEEKPFYFTLGSLSSRKNPGWILRHAELFPDETFVISGKALKSNVPAELGGINSMPNIIMTGYLSDAEVKAIYTRAKAFIFPSYFEGFGLPPLEALSCGCPIIISEASCLPEIYGGCAHYINPDDPAVDLDRVLDEPVDAPDSLLEKFTLRRTAERLYEVIQRYL